MPLIQKQISRFRQRYASHDELYDAAYYECVDRKAKASADVIAGSIVDEFAPARVLDAGCGTGVLLSALRSKGVAGDGLEYSRAALVYCRKQRLNVRQFDLEHEMPSGLHGQYDVAISMEVAEHLPAKIAERFVRLLCRSASVVVFTAATPGQGGHDHVNEQPHEYWITKFEKNGFCHDKERSLQWRSKWAAQDVTWFYHRNLMIFVRS